MFLKDGKAVCLICFSKLVYNFTRLCEKCDRTREKTEYFDLKTRDNKMA